MENEEKILEVKDLRVSFNTYAGEVQCGARRGLSSCTRARPCAIVGESGCGKTVTVQSHHAAAPTAFRHHQRGLPDPLPRRGRAANG